MKFDPFLVGTSGMFDRLVSTICEPRPPIDLEAWAIAKLRFGTESPFPGAYDPDRFPFYSRLLEVLSPDHPARVIVLRGSAQIGKTVIGEIFLGATQALDPGPFMVVHPTETNAVRWVIAKWRPLVRNTLALSEIYRLPRLQRGRGVTGDAGTPRRRWLGDHLRRQQCGVASICAAADAG